jgi:prepilin-type N-terminal cleavage/methylation domain-containing protein
MGVTIKKDFCNSTMNNSRNNNGFTLPEMMVSLAMGSMVLFAIMQHFSGLARSAKDYEIRLETLSHAQAIMQTISTELRMAGNGVPFDQPNFEIGESNLVLSNPSVTLPIIISDSTASKISFRLNETGNVAILTADFNPAVSLVASITSTEGIEVGSTIFITNSTISGDEGLYGVVASVDETLKRVTLANGYVALSGAIFGKGSVLEPVPIVTYTDEWLNTGVSRDSGNGKVLLGENASVSFEYLDKDGSEMTLPLTEFDLVNNFRSVRINVEKISFTPLSTGENYEVNLSQIVSIRNLSLLY